MTIAERLFMHRGVAVMAIALIGAVAGTLVLAPGALGQNVLNQYDDGGDVDPGGGAGANPDSGAGNGDAGDGGSGSLGTGDGAGELPFTGYPMTPLVLTLLLVLAVGILVRVGIAVRDRLNAKTASSGSFSPFD